MSNRRVFNFLMTVVLATIVSMVALGQQTTHNPSGVFTPHATSSTAASNCGVTEEKLRQEGYIYKYTFKTESPAMSWVEGCSAGSLFRDTHGHAVAPGSACFLKAKESDECAFAGTCNNRAGLAFSVSADKVEADLAPTAPAPAAATVFASSAVASAIVAPAAESASATTSVGLDPILPWNPPASDTSPRRSVLDQFAGEDEGPEGEGLCETSPGLKSLWVGGWLLRQPVCHLKRTALILAGSAAAYTGTAYGLGLWPFKQKATATTPTLKPPTATPAACTLLYQLGVCPNKGPGGTCPNECV